MPAWRRDHQSHFDEWTAFHEGYVLGILSQFADLYTPPTATRPIIRELRWYVEYLDTRVAEGELEDVRRGDAMIVAEMAMAEHARTLPE